MAYYTALIAAWNGATQPPAGVTGTALTSSMATSQKLTAVNAWTLTGVVPTSFYCSGSDILNAMDWNEFKALTAAQQSNLMMLCSNPGQLLGGTANLSHMTDGMILGYFTTSSGPTIAALTALAKGQVTPWANTPVAQGGGGLNGPTVISEDLRLAGGLT